ncbi:MAG: DUF393 domain-containing protein [Pseudomonadota bacterium]
MNDAEETDGLKVYYNSACPVCAAGIDRQRRQMAREKPAKSVAWIDIADDPDAVTDLGANIDAVRHSLHVVSGDALHVGADAFVKLAQATPSQAWLSRIFGSRLLKPLSHFFYDRFADFLFWWNMRKGRW